MRKNGISLLLRRLSSKDHLLLSIITHYFQAFMVCSFLFIDSLWISLFIRVLVRLALFRNSGYKMLLHGGETPNDEKHLAASTPQRNGFTKPGGHLGPMYLRNNNGQDAWNLEGRALSALSRFGENARMVSEPVWLRRVQHQHAIMEPPSNN